MLQILSKLTGFNASFFTITEVVKEANRKFGQTWLIINDKIMPISSFGSDYIEVTNLGIIPGSQISSIKPWMPEPGIYLNSEDDRKFLYLHRIPKRQWLKSFSIGNNYDHRHITDYEKINVPIIYEYWKNYQDTDLDWLFIDKYLVYKIHVVGKVYNKTITVTDEAFYSEVFDKWHKLYNITLTKAPQGPEVDASSKTLS